MVSVRAAKMVKNWRVNVENFTGLECLGGIRRRVPQDARN
jgi:hypothetical protein